MSAGATPVAAGDAADRLLRLPRCQVLLVHDATRVDRVAAGDVDVLQSGGMLFITCGAAFSYPLINQPVLKAEDRVYILPAAAPAPAAAGGAATLPAGAPQHYIIYVAPDVPADDVERWEEVLASTTQMRAHMAAEATAASAAAAAPTAPAAAAAAASTAVVPATASSSSRPSSALGASRARSAAHSSPAATSATAAGRVGAALSTALLMTGRLAATAVVAGARVAGRGVAITARSMKGYFTPAPPGTHVRPETVARLEKAKVVSRMAVTVSAGLVAGAAAMAKSLGSALSEAVLSTDVGEALKKGGSSDTGRAAKQVARSGLVAFAEVWDSLEVAARVFSEQAAPGVLEFAQHRYGDAGAEVARHSLTVAGNLTQVGLNVRNLGVGGMVRATAAETARHVILHDGTTGGELEITPGVGALALTDAAPGSRASAPAVLTAGPAAAAASAPVVPVAAPVGGGAAAVPVAMPLVG